MKAFYRDLVDFTIASESATGLTFQAGAVKLSLHQRTRGYDRQGTRSELPGVQLAFLVRPTSCNDSARRTDRPPPLLPASPIMGRAPCRPHGALGAHPPGLANF